MSKAILEFSYRHLNEHNVELADSEGHVAVISRGRFDALYKLVEDPELLPVVVESVEPVAEIKAAE